MPIDIWAKDTAPTVGVTGFCMGRLAVATNVPSSREMRDLDAAGAPFYGYAPHPGGCFDTTTSTKKPVLWSSGKLDLFGG